MNKAWIIAAAVSLGGSCVASGQTPGMLPAPTAAAPEPSSQPPTGARSDATASGHGGLTDNQIADQVDARIANLKAGLRLTSDQDRDWPGLSSVLHDVGVDQLKQRLAASYSRDERREGRYKDRRDAGDPPETSPDAIDGMRREANTLSARADNLRRLANAAEPIFKTLNEGQKRDVVRFLRASFREE